MHIQNLVLHPSPLHQAIVLIRKHRRSPKILSLLRRHVRVGDNDNNIAHLHPPGSRTIEANDPAAAFSANGVGFEALAVIVVHDLHFLAFHDVGCFEQVLINRDAADVVQVGLRDADPVYFAFKNFDEHEDGQVV